MTTATAISALKLPADSLVDQRVPKKLLVENGAPTAADKRKINEGIEELRWVAALKPATIGVPAYRDDVREYVEVAVLTAALRADAKVQRLVELIHRAIPYPVLLIVDADSGIHLSLCHLRWSQGQSGQMVLDGVPLCVALGPQSNATDAFLASLAVASQPGHDLCAFYDGWVQRFEAFAAAQVSASFRLCESPAAVEARRQALAQRQQILREVAQLRADASKEKQLNRRVDINLKLNSLESLLAENLSHL